MLSIIKLTYPVSGEKKEAGTKPTSEMKKPVNFTTSKISPALIFLQ